MPEPTQDPVRAGQPPSTADRLAGVLSNMAKVGAGVLIFSDFFSKPPGIDPSTLAAAALLAAIAQGLEGTIATILERVLSSPSGK